MVHCQSPGKFYFFYFSHPLEITWEGRTSISGTRSDALSCLRTLKWTCGSDTKLPPSQGRPWCALCDGPRRSVGDRMTFTLHLPARGFKIGAITSCHCARPRLRAVDCQLWLTRLVCGDAHVKLLDWDVSFFAPVSRSCAHIFSEPLAITERSKKQNHCIIKHDKMMHCDESCSGHQWRAEVARVFTVCTSGTS